MFNRLFSAAFLIVATSTGAMAADMPAKTMDTAMGKVLADSRGMTLYTFDNDQAGKSNCAGECAQNWPPLTAASGAMMTGDWSVIDRPDGSKQWAYKGKPLYLWVKDAKPGDTTGEGVKGVWHAAKP